MIMRFDFEGGHQPVADIDDPGVFSRPLYDELAASGQTLEMHLA